MSEALNMSLDEIIRNNKKSLHSHPRGRGRDHARPFGSAAGPIRRFANRGPPRPTPYISPMVQQMQGHYIGGAAPDTGAGTKLYISNLQFGVSNEDIQGTAEVVFLRQSDALAALRRYNNVQLDGKPMNIELVGMNIVTPVAVPPASRGILGNYVAAPRRIKNRQDRVVSWGEDQCGGSHGIGRSRGQGRSASEKISSEDLDADLEKYRLEAMHIN